jgi:hypothetical protein
VVRAQSDDFTGRVHDAVASLADSGIEDSYRQACVTKMPVFGRTGLYAGDHTWIGFEYAIFPLSDDGVTVNKCLAIECVGPSGASSIGGEAFAAPAEEAESGKAGHHER